MSLKPGNSVLSFLSSYDESVVDLALSARKIIVETLPEIIEEVDMPAKMVAYSYGKKYAQLICTLIPSKKGVKLGFYKGNDLPDPQKLLEGTGKISRYVQLKNEDQINSTAIKNLILEALAAYKERTAL